MHIAVGLLLAGAFSGAPVALDAPVYGAADGDQVDPAVAYAGSVGLVVWEDGRSGGPGVWGMRVDADGAPLDVTGFRIESGGALAPRVASNGSVFLVVWDDFGEAAIRGARVDLSGNVLDTEPLVLSAEPPDGVSRRQRQPDVASDGSDFLVVWKEIDDAAEDIGGVRVDGGGALLDDSDIVIATGAGDRDTPAVSWDGSGYVVAWSLSGTDSDGVHGTRVVAGAAGAVVRLGDSQALGRVQVASGGGTSLVVWAGGGAIRGARLEPDGGAPDDPALFLDDGGVTVSDPALAFHLDDFLVTWRDERDDNEGDVYGAYVSTAGVPSAPAPIISSVVDDGMPALVAHPGGALLAWQEDPGATLDGADIRAALIATAGTVGAEHELSRSAQLHDEVTAVFSGDGYVVTLRDVRGGERSARSFSVDVTGAPDGASSLLHAGGGISPAAAAHPGGALIAFSTGAQIATRVVDEHGVPVDAAAYPAAPTTYQRTPGVAFDGTRHLVVWGDYQLQQSGFISFDVRAARVAPDGTVLDAGGFVLADVSAAGAYPEVAFDGADFVVAWAMPFFQNMVLQVARFDPDTNAPGLVVPVERGRVDSFDTTPATVDVASGGGVTMVAWDTGYDIHIVRLSSSGEPLGTIVLDGGGIRYDEPRVVFDGESFLVSYATGGTRWSSIWLVRVRPDGTLLDEEPTLIAQPSSGVTSYELASDGALGSLLTYTAYDADPTWASVRAFAVAIQEGAPGDACALPLECASAHCVDGVCCESACDEGCGNCGASGLCEPVAEGSLCRAADGVCDSEERCDGAAVACPGDDVQPTTVLCRPEASVCDAEERCDGSAKSCPSDRAVDASVGRLCRAALGPCDVDESCDGSMQCPDDEAASSRFVCREGYCEEGMQYLPEECGDSTTGCPDSFGFSCAPYLCASDGMQCDSTCDEQRPCTLDGWRCVEGRCEQPNDAGTVSAGDGGSGGDVSPPDGGDGPGGAPDACGCASADDDGTTPAGALLAVIGCLALAGVRTSRARASSSK